MVERVIQMKTYNEFMRWNIDTSLIGLEKSPNDNLYFCTPKGAHVIGWAGVDGIHFCFVEGFGEMVFAVSPLNNTKEYVHPIANSFSDFMRLILACGNASALEKAHYWDDEEVFHSFSIDDVTKEHLLALDMIQKKLHLKPMEHPFAYIKQVQATFDYSKIEPATDSEEFIRPDLDSSEWNVSFDGGFWGPYQQQQAGQEVSTNIQFTFDNKTWHIPSVYSCGEGLVVDFCVQVPLEQIKQFIKKWNITANSNYSCWTKDEELRIQEDHPMNLNIRPTLILNGKTILFSRGSGLSWNPCLTESNEVESEAVLKHYNLDPVNGWSIYRTSFPWPTAPKPQISSLSMTIAPEPVAIAGPHFYASSPGESICFTNPITNIQHTLTIQEYEQQALPEDHFNDQDYYFPTHYAAMGYTIYPNLLDDDFYIHDYGDADNPRKKQIESGEFQDSVVYSMIAMMSNSDSQTPLRFGGVEQGVVRTVCSSMHFDLVDTVEWQIIFLKKSCADLTVKII